MFLHLTEFIMMKRVVPLLLSFGLTGAACAQEAVFQTKTLTPETALKAAQAALESCRKQGYQVAVAVSDRGGLVQVLLSQLVRQQRADRPAAPAPAPAGGNPPSGP